MIAAAIIAIAAAVIVCAGAYVVASRREADRTAAADAALKEARKELRNAYQTHNLAAIVAAKRKRDRLLERR